jgi:hypothetical protein
VYVWQKKFCFEKDLKLFTDKVLLFLFLIKIDICVRFFQLIASNKWLSYSAKRFRLDQLYRLKKRGFEII